jgi:hypothetical protein
MGVLFRVIGVFFVAVAGLLIYAVINAVTSEGGARAGVAAGYIVGSILLIAAAVWLWKAAARRRAQGPGTAP